MFATNSPRKLLFRSFGVPIYADLGAAVLFAIIVMIYGSGGPRQLLLALGIAVVGFGSVIAHELGHAWSVQKLGYGRSEIQLSTFGGVTRWRGQPKHPDRIKVALAGPAVSLALAAAFFGIDAGVGAQSGWYVGGLLTAGWILNLAWTIFNLLPIHPLDGGQALRSLLAMRMPARVALKRSLVLSGAVGGAIALWGIASGNFFVALVVGMMLLQNWREWQQLQL